ncbi:MAG TPA: NHL repeat-containing protein, partial [Bacteroidia bacterium]|nr:NHL repeat-containing protein [Bacteroidia bacterium]
MKKILFLLFIVNVQWMSGQTIFTMCGNGVPGFSGDGGLAIAAELSLPVGVAIDSMGNIYLADESNQRIRKINASGIISTVAGNGTAGYAGDGGLATAAELNYPSAVALDKKGNLYIADRINNCIRRVNPSGIISTICGTGVAGYSGDGGAATSAQLKGPEGLGTDRRGNIYIADTYNSRVRKIDTLGIITTVAGDSLKGYNGDGILATKAQLNVPYAVCADKNGNLYIADLGNQVIRMVNTSGIISTVAGNGTITYSGDGGLATGAGLSDPNGLALDAAGNLFISDLGNSRIRKVNTSGIITTFAGNGIQGYSGDGGPATSAELFWPQGIAADGEGNIYTTDQNNNCLRKISMSTGINEWTAKDAYMAKVGPNPSNGICWMFTTNHTSSFIEFYNMLGEVILTEKTVSDKTAINLCSQPKGI